jgi:hypothetical protein
LISLLYDHCLLRTISNLSLLPPMLYFIFYGLLSRLPCFRSSTFDRLQCLLDLLDSLSRNRCSTSERIMHLQPRQFLDFAHSATQAILDLIASADARRTKAPPRHVGVSNRDGVLLRQRGEILLLERPGVRSDVVCRLGEEVFAGEEEERRRKQNAGKNGAVPHEDGATQRCHADIEQCWREGFVRGDEGLGTI